MRRLLTAVIAVLWLLPGAAFAGPSKAGPQKLDATLAARATAPTGSSRVIIQTRSGATVDALVARLGGVAGRRLAALDAQIAEVPDQALTALAADAAVTGVRLDRPVFATMERTGATVGAAWVRENLGYDGTGVAVAIVDSGVTAWHDDLTGQATIVTDPGGTVSIGGSQRVVRFVDFVNGWPSTYDDFGHGTHVAGIIGGNGYDSTGARTGVAPGVSLVALKVLDSAGRGYISDVIAAIDYAVANRDALNLRVLNLSVAAAVVESYWTDPLTIAARRAVEAGIVVVTSAGNLGRNADGAPQYGAITAPGNAPWVITVGAASHQGTPDRADDIVASFSSRGPTYLDYTAKPDLVAPGVGLESLSDPSSAIYTAHPEWRLSGSVATWYLPYLSLTGTSMAAPVVSGTIALMVQANPTLTPNAVKAILEYTAETYAGYDPLTEGAGFLNARGAVRLAELVAGQPARPDDAADQATWNRHIIWGNHRVGGGLIHAEANAWDENIVWGTAFTDDGENIVWGTRCDDESCDNIVWGTGFDESIVWGTGRSGDNIVWGTGSHENIVWGTECGGDDCENIVWGSLCDAEGCDNIVWGTASPDDNIVWGTTGDDNIVWGSAGDPDNIVWGNLRDEDNIVWGTTAPPPTTEPAPTTEPPPVVEPVTTTPKGKKK
jgi:serine protease AprX